MVEIKVNLYAEPKENETFEVLSVEEKDIETQDGLKPAIQVNLKPQVETDVKYSVTLWLSDNASMTSKLGAFTVALGNNTSKWIGKKIYFVSWEYSNREIKVV